MARKRARGEGRKKRPKHGAAEPLSLDDPALVAGLQLYSAGRHGEARVALLAVLERRPAHPVALHLLGLVELATGQTQAARRHVEAAVAHAPTYVEALNSLGSVYRELGELDRAETAFRQAIALRPELAEPYLNLGLTLGAQRRMAEAEQTYRRAIACKPGFARAHQGLGLALFAQGRHEACVDACRAALRLDPTLATAEQTLGLALEQLGQDDAALSAYGRLVALRPEDAEAHRALGRVATMSGAYEAAIAALRRAASLAPGDTATGHLLGEALAAAGRHREAARAHRAVLEMEPEHPGSLPALVGCLHELCVWEGLGALAERADRVTRARLAAGEPIGETPGVVVRCDDAAFNLDVARHWSEAIVARFPGLEPLARPAAPAERPLRVGYLSADYHDHATVHLMRGLFAAHDRAQVQVRAYAYGPPNAGPERRRLAADADAFVELNGLSDRAAAERIAADGVDVLVDLKGHTAGARLGMCAWRPAPVQVTYLGYPGSTGAPFFDYLVGDALVSPLTHAHHYTEKLVLLPHSYQVNDRAPPRGAVPAREACGLPAEGLVFCSFNRTYKIEPTVFAVWMRLLHAVDGAVLWLYRSNEDAADNLRREAARAGVDPARVVFADKIDKAAHLGRLMLADLFLDTRTCNGHTTCSDALQVGVPVVTMLGRHFASRVAASLLTAAGVPQLVTPDLPAYEALALHLARQPEERLALRRQLVATHDTVPLFDTVRTARALERAYATMWSRHARGEPPDHIVVPDESQPHQRG